MEKPSSAPANERVFIGILPIYNAIHNKNKRDLIIIVALAVAYFGGAVISQGRSDEAFRNSEYIKATQPQMFVDWSQHFMHTYPHLLKICNVIYAHFYYFMCFLVLFASRAFMSQRNWYWWFYRGVCATMYCFVFVQVFPCAPPRMYKEDYFDPDPEIWKIADKSPFLNSYAAFPSIHTLWSLMTSCAIYILANQIVVDDYDNIIQAFTKTVGKYFLKLYAVCYTLIIIFIVLSIAHHFVIDVVAGLCIYLFVYKLMTDEVSNRPDFGSQGYKVVTKSLEEHDVSDNDYDEGQVVVVNVGSGAANGSGVETPLESTGNYLEDLVSVQGSSPKQGKATKKE